MCKIAPVVRQFISIVCCHLLTISAGLVSGWAQINFLDLQDENSTFPTGPLTSEQLALIVSLMNLGTLIGNFTIVPITRLIGAKRAIHLSGLPLILSTILIIYAKNAYYLYASRILTGFIVGTTSVAIPELISEISLDNVRGALASLADPSYNTGIILSYFMATYMNSMDQAKVQLILPSIFMVVLFFIPESPEFWIKKKIEKRAQDSRKFYKGKNVVGPAKVEFIPDSSNDSVNAGIRATLKKYYTPQAKKAFFFSFTVAYLGYSCGSFTLAMYITDIFNMTGSPLSEKNMSLIVSIVPLVSNVIFSNVVERFNRKTLYISSAIMASIFYFLFAAYGQFLLKQPEYEWLPPIGYTFIAFSCGMGVFPIPYVLLVEIFPKEIRGIGIALGVSLMWSCLFIWGYIFPFAMNSFGIAVCMLFFAAICLFNAIYYFLFIPETRGKSYDEIQSILAE